MKNLDSDLETKNRVSLINDLLRLRSIIRESAKAIKDEKCFLDFFRLFDELPEGRRSFDPRILDKHKMMANCSTFYDCMECYLNNMDRPIEEIYEIWKKEKPYE